MVEAMKKRISKSYEFVASIAEVKATYVKVRAILKDMYMTYMIHDNEYDTLFTYNQQIYFKLFDSMKYDFE